MRDMIKMGLILLLITSISGLVLGVTNSMTEGIIMERAMEGDIASMQALIADADTFDAVTGEGIDDVALVQEVFAGKQGDEVVGFTIKLNPSGYGGEIEIMVGISITSEITGVEILSHTETPGLGSKITEPEFREKFIGKATAESTSVDAISGATVSSDAVNQGVRTAALLYEEVLKN